ncbi:ComEC family competence protein [Candidatus Parcubacteria bacterium]|uniref:ComEC/Rec2-related protein domain-containing protein n=1 Tax=Candidatus Kaiserbacteria bacterium CG10_big_fil_rev_8_21_14_0_10_47_16 TaxID=1974608 RepID=A0A2H0UDQ3_9BACT|nr:ComEC family competence protein [Candidatus Parcubacteria bacterium]PIR84553.1 MAG: hypothetical protein COU16_03180 [Candidatus Kaiserbacteria bacterium CG10_big_fil_rev_8_21_14_0_10_47_16]
MIYLARQGVLRYSYQSGMSSVLFYGSAIAFCVGIFFASFAIFPQAFILLLFAISFVFGVLWRRTGSARSSPFFFVSLLLLCFALGLFRIDVTRTHESAFVPFENQDVTLEGVVAREPDIRSNSQQLYIRETQSEELVLVTTDAFADISYGDRLVFTGTLEAPESFETDLGRTFNYSGYLRARGVTHTVSFAEVTVVARGEGNPIIAGLLIAKHAFMRELEYALPEPSAGLAEGLLLGAKRALGDNLEEAFRRVGIIHIIVLSGYNVMIVAEAIMRLLSFFFKPRIRMLIGITAISFFALIVGLSATVVRASIMAALVLIARATGRTASVTRSLMFAGVVMVLINPYLLVFDPGFQLSFMATLGLIFLAPLIERKLHFAPTTFQIREFITATISTQIMVLPILLFLIGQFSVVAILANVLVLPAVPLAMGLSFVTAVIGFVIPQLALIVGFITHLSLAYIVHVAEILSLLPFASFLVPAFPFWIVIVLYALLTHMIVRWSKREDDHARQIHNDARLTGFSALRTQYAEWTVVPLESVKAKIKSPREELRSSRGDFPFR